MTTETHPWLRPSALPRLALCAQWRGEADDEKSKYAARGHTIDAAFRALIAGENVDASHLSQEEREGIRWAVDTARALSGGYALESREEFLRVSALGITGTADLLCTGAGWSADLKTGMHYDYKEQQAAYALGFMDAHFLFEPSDEWIVYLFYCDLREVETLRFTREYAEKMIRKVLAKVAENTPPEVNEFCNWCARKFDCSARKEALGLVPFDDLKSLDFAKADSNRLREFVLCSDTVGEFAKQAREELKSRRLAGEKIPGVSLVSKRGPRKLAAEHLAPLVEKIGAEMVLSALGLISESKAQELWIGSAIEAPFPSERVEEMPGSCFVTIRRPKA